MSTGPAAVSSDYGTRYGREADAEVRAITVIKSPPASSGAGDVELVGGDGPVPATAEVLRVGRAQIAEGCSRQLGGQGGDGEYQP